MLGIYHASASAIAITCDCVIQIYINIASEILAPNVTYVFGFLK